MMFLFIKQLPLQTCNSCVNNLKTKCKVNLAGTIFKYIRKGSCQSKAPQSLFDFPLVEQVGRPIRELLVTGRTCMPLLNLEGYCAICACQCDSQVITGQKCHLLSSFGSCHGSFMYHGNYSVKRLSGQFQIRSFWALGLQCMVSSAIRTYLLPLGDNQG